MFAQLKNEIFDTVRPYITLPLMGLDISDRAAKFVKFDTLASEIECYGELEIPEGLIEHGSIKSEDGVAAAFKNYFSKNQKHFNPFVAVSLPEESGFLRVVQVPKIKQEDIGNAIRWEIEGNVPLPSEDLYFDYEVINNPEFTGKDHLDVVITAFPKTIIESYLRVLRAAGFRPLALELESQAIIRSVIPAIQKKAVVVADMGKTRTSLIVYAAGALRYTTTIDFGGKILEENISRSMNVPLAEARELKIKYGISKSEFEGKLFSDLLPALSALADEFKRTIEYYLHHAEHSHDGNAIEKILLVGGDANLFGLSTYLSSTLKIPTGIVSPLELFFEAQARPISPLPRHTSLGYATAMGLALRNYYQDRNHA